jgi:CxxC motif-containing protein (DUF1111 family)
LLTAVAGEGYFGEPLIARVSDWAAFSAGVQQFSRVWGENDGVGVSFNERSCLACHAVPMPGGAGLTTGTYVFMSAQVRDEMGGHVFQRLRRSASGIIEQPIPADATRRRAPPLFGLGLLERVPLDELTKPRQGPDFISGRLGGTSTDVGRFGWKAGVPDLASFIKRAFSIELGFGSKALEATHYRSLPTAMEEVTTFVRMLSPPPMKEKHTLLEQHGKNIFERIGCSQCHTPILHVRNVQASNEIDEIHPYTDLLVHNMGKGLSDGISDGAASGLDFRTAPLWGSASFGPPYLHDGRANDLPEAIDEHDGEARLTRLRWLTLTHEDRRALLYFLRSL